MSREEILRKQYEKSTQRAGVPSSLPKGDQGFGLPVTVTRRIVQEQVNIPQHAAVLKDVDKPNANVLDEAMSLSVINRAEPRQRAPDASDFFAATDSEIGEFVSYVRRAKELLSETHDEAVLKTEAVLFEVESNEYVEIGSSLGILGNEIVCVGGGAIPYAQLSALALVHGMELGRYDVFKMLLSALSTDDVSSAESACALARRSGFLRLLDKPKLRRKILMISGGILLWTIAREFAHVALEHEFDLEEDAWSFGSEVEADVLATRILENSPFAEYTFESRLLWLYQEARQMEVMRDEDDGPSNAQRRYEALLQENPRKARKYGFLAD